jgi:hypothetical protein
VHHKNALDGVTARLKAGTLEGPNAKGYYKSKVEMYHLDNVNNGGWTTKKNSKSTFFPDSWSKDKVTSEITQGFSNKKSIGLHKYEGTMSDGTKVQFFSKTGKFEDIETAFPIYVTD